ncbi:uncharacterized protein B0H18DRAFT_844151, partial [Fomitopsis serialis]|uniref:uncharacterized protein n=1 Tax=Fomitopsis serialis TaxID=139415 RepID=UPI002008EA7C
TLFEKWSEERRKLGVDEWAPFENEEEWELFSWLIKHVGQNDIDEFLKLSIIKNRCKLSATSKYKFFKQVDDLPTGVKWKCDDITVTGDRVGDDDKTMTEELELWIRDPVECIRELIGNPAFREYIAYAPERVFADEAGTNRIFDEM